MRTGPHRQPRRPRPRPSPAEHAQRTTRHIITACTSPPNARPAPNCHPASIESTGPRPRSLGPQLLPAARLPEYQYVRSGVCSHVSQGEHGGDTALRSTSVIRVPRTPSPKPPRISHRLTRRSPSALVMHPPLSHTYTQLIAGTHCPCRSHRQRTMRTPGSRIAHDLSWNGCAFLLFLPFEPLVPSVPRAPE